LPFNAPLLPVVVCSLFRLPTGADDELKNDELQTDLPAEVADRSSYRDRQRHTAFPQCPDLPLPREERPSNYVDNWRVLCCRF
jgi:hypothetical protein